MLHHFLSLFLDFFLIHNVLLSDTTLIQIQY